MQILCCNRTQHRISTLRTRMKLHGFARFHDIKNKIVKDRQTILLCSSIHEFKHFTLNVHLPIWIIDSSSVAGQCLRKPRQFLTQVYRKPRFYTALSLSRICNDWCKLCARCCYFNCVQPFDALFRIICKSYMGFSFRQDQKQKRAIHLSVLLIYAIQQFAHS